MLETRPVPALARHAHRRAAVVVAPVGPVARQRRRPKPLVRVDGRGAQTREGAVVLEETADGVLGQRREPVVRSQGR